MARHIEKQELKTDDLERISGIFSVYEERAATIAQQMKVRHIESIHAQNVKSLFIAIDDIRRAMAKIVEGFDVAVIQDRNIDSAIDGTNGDKESKR